MLSLIACRAQLNYAANCRLPPFIAKRLSNLADRVVDARVGLQREPAVMGGETHRVLACAVERHQRDMSAWLRGIVGLTQGALQQRT